MDVQLCGFNARQCNAADAVAAAAHARARIAQEEYLSAEEFFAVFGVEKGVYAALPQWKKLILKKGVNLF